jgi:hypothetical protein
MNRLKPSQAAGGSANRRGSPKPAVHKGLAKAVPSLKISYFQYVIENSQGWEGGNKVLLTMLTRQNLPSVWLKERFH